MQTELCVLAARVRRGEPGAEARWRRAFGPQMERIVRRVVRRGPCGSGFTRRIAAAGAALRRRGAVDRETPDAELARRLGEAVLGGLRREGNGGAPPADTVDERSRLHATALG